MSRQNHSTFLLFETTSGRTLLIKTQGDYFVTDWSNIDWRGLHRLADPLIRLSAKCLQMEMDSIDIAEFVSVNGNRATVGIRASAPSSTLENTETTKNVCYSFISRTTTPANLAKGTLIDDPVISGHIDTAVEAFLKENGKRTISSPIRIAVNNDSDAIVVHGKYNKKPIPTYNKEPPIAVSDAFVDCVGRSSRKAIITYTGGEITVEYDAESFFESLAIALKDQTPIDIVYQRDADLKGRPLLKLVSICPPAITGD